MVQQTSTLCISQSALEKNIKFLRKVVGKVPRISFVVKANAYGHGISDYVPLAEKLGIDHFSVFSDYEAQEVKKSIKNKATTIMIMGMVDPTNMSWVIRNGIEFFIAEPETLRYAIKASKRLNIKAKIHIDLETGMNRTGLDQSDLEEVIQLIKDNPDSIEVIGVCTHYAGAESISNHYRVSRQIKKFNKLDKWIREQGITPQIRHTACSAASVSYPQTRMDLVRIGVMQYGFWPTDETFISYINGRKIKKNPLTPILSWESKIMSVKDVPAGEFIGYGDSFLANEDMKIAIVPVGYTNGYARILSNRSSILVRGMRVSVIGTVNMNLSILNVSQVPDIKKGDKVILVGTQGEHTISFASFREQKNALNYEILARLPGNIPRKIVD